ncbi:MAG TPA: hypothetical protein VKA19_04660 [Alphaproteobacteria bacterium]|nr:hypothetical protein [Alphaproteobacteria bacterium]
MSVMHYRRSRWILALAAGCLIAFAGVKTTSADPVAADASAPSPQVTEAIKAKLNDPNSLLGVLVAKMPELRAGIEARLREAVASDGLIGLEDESFRIGWEYGQRYMRRFAQTADGAALLDFLKSLRTVVTKMHNASAIGCFDWMFGDKPLDIQKSGITIDDVKAVDAAMIAVIRTGAEGKPQPPAKNIDDLVSQVATRAYAAAKSYEAGWAFLSNPGKVTTDHEKASVCKDVDALYGEILALPKDNAVAVTRVLFASSKPATTGAN